MGLQFCDVSGYAIIVVPGLDNSSVVTLHHWRHIDGDRDPTEEEVLSEVNIAGCPTVDESDDVEYAKNHDNWVSSHLGPVLQDVGVQVPKDTTVSICLPETAAALTDYPIERLDNYCMKLGKNYRGVSFVRAKLPRLLENVPVGSDLAVYTVNPKNNIRIYDRSGRVPRLIHTGRIHEALDTTPPKPDLEHPEWLKALQKRFLNPEDKLEPRDDDPPVVDTVDILGKRVIDWVDRHLAPAFRFAMPPDSLPVRHVHLFMPTEDLCANPNNTYNSVREQVVKRLQKNPHLPGVTVELVGTTDNLRSLAVLDPVFYKCDEALVSRIQHLVSIEHTANEGIVYVDRRIGKSVEVIYTKKVALTQTYDDSSELNIALKDALHKIRDNEKDLTPFMTLLVALNGGARSNDWFRPPVQLCMGAKYFLRDRENDYDGPAREHRKREEDVQVPQFRHAVVIDAGSRGTRALVYRWRINGVAEPEVQDPVQGAIAHPRLPYLQFLGSCREGNGIATKQVGQLPVYVAALFTKLNALLAPLGAANPPLVLATTPLIALATGGMRSKRKLAVGANTLHLYNDFVVAIRTAIEAEAVGYFSATFEVADGESEAMYGWITANYAIGLLEHATAASKGFLEMGGASLQVAYQVAAGYARRYMPLSINYRGFQRDFRVYTREIDDLGAEEARRRFVLERSGTLGDGFTIDRTWPLNAPLPDLNPPVVGTGLRVAVADVGRVFVGQLGNSLRPVIQLLPRPFLKADHPDLDREIEFVGGAGFWYLSEGIYPADVNAAHTFNEVDLINLILDFATIPWGIHAAPAQLAAETKIDAMTDPEVNGSGIDGADIAAMRANLIAREVTSKTKHKSALLFNALLVFATLYIGVRIRLAASFQPYDGVNQRNAAGGEQKVSYSWTLGRALLHAINSAVPVAAGLGD